MRSDTSFVPPTSDYWAQQWAQITEAPDHAAYRDACWVFDATLSKSLPVNPQAEALELGCYPGGFMVYLHKRFGYRVSGLDFVPGSANLAASLRAEGIAVGEVLEADVLEITPTPRYDVVASFGFLEHFPDPALVLRRHVEWLRPGGHLVVTVPNFRWLQWALHRSLDETNLRRHNTAAMHRQLFRRVLPALGVDIVQLDFVGVCGFWYEQDPARSPRQRTMADLATKVFGRADRVLSSLSRDVANPLTSPFLVCVGRLNG